ncbi:kinesin light chain [Cladorrhinum sp. PSN332]|nr:kinesin light chain [Cladorrhinum sp. PSN332]
MMHSISFGSGNQGQQIAHNSGIINAEFHLPPERPETPPQPFANIPFSRDLDFVNRGDILDQIHHRFSEPAARVALVGLGGIGKSQLAIEYCYRVAAEQPGAWVFWVYANDRDVFYQPTSGGVYNWQPFANYLPQSRNGSIITITRNKDLAFRLTGRYENVIEARAPRSLPEKYLAELRESERKKSRLLQRDAGDIRRDGGALNAILTIWQISFDHIRSKRPFAADLLSLMSFFDRQGIPGWVLKGPRIARGVLTKDPDEGEDEGGDEESDYGSSATDGNADDDIDDNMDGGFEDDLAMLRDYCLIVIDKAGNDFEMYGLQYIDRILMSFPAGHYENWALCQSLFAYVQVALGYRPSENAAEGWAMILYNGGWYAWSQGRYEVAQQMLGKARRVREKRLGKEDVATLASISLLALVLLDRGRWEEAEKLFVQVMETNKTKLGADHPDTLVSMNNLASTYRNQGRWEEAEKLFVQVMEIRKTKFGADHPDTLVTMGNLALAYMNQGRLEEAEKLFVQGRWEEAEKLDAQVMETNKTKLGADHPSTLASMNNLALTYTNQGRWEEAEKLFVQVVETNKTKLGADHPDTLTSMANLALTYRNQGRWEEAEKLDVQVMETRKTKLGADHPDTLTSMNSLSCTWKSQGRHADALALMKDCAQARQRVLGNEHPYTLSSLATVAEWSR